MSDDRTIPLGSTTPADLPTNQSASTTPSPFPEEQEVRNFTRVTNAGFLAEVFHKLPDGAYAAVCGKQGDPTTGGWMAKRADQSVNSLQPSYNNYLSCSSFKPSDDGTFTVQKSQFAACHFLMLDDLGTKKSLDRLAGFPLSWLIETSPGNYQGGIILAEPITDGAMAVRLLDAIIAAGLCDAGASGPLSRWARLPVASNGKQKYADKNGKAFRCRLVEWRPDKRYTPQEILDGLKLELVPTAPVVPTNIPAGNMGSGILESDEVLTLRADENPLITALKLRGLYKTPMGEGKHDITCPWVSEHTDAIDSGTAYFEPDDQYSVGGFHCFHSHGDRYKIAQLAENLQVPLSVAKNKSCIRVVSGELHRVVAAAERVLVLRGRHYQCGGLIVSIATDPATGNPTIKETRLAALTKELSQATDWERFSESLGGYVACDPPTRHVGILADAQHYEHLPALEGLVRQPYFRGSDGVLVIQSGYDPVSKIFGVFDAKQFVIPEPTLDAARAALAMLVDLLSEFHFVADTDRAAALSAFFTAATRQSYDFAPGYHAKAAVFGSGKSYLCETIGCFTGPGGTEKVSYPKTSEEATKVILALLMKSPAGIEFDDLDTDWIPHGVINRMMTSAKITDRILGVSKTATVSTRTLILGSGNNVGPIRDLLRRVLTIHIDARCANPAMLTYIKRPAEMVRKNRGKYVAAVLTIILAWRAAGSPRVGAGDIVTYGGAWSDYCRYPLTWLGLPDPVTSLLEQIKQDPDAEALGHLMQAWLAEFGHAATTVRKAVEHAKKTVSNDLIDAIREFPLEERGEINHGKFGWFLKKNANRIVDGYAFQRASAGGRVAWQVVAVNATAVPLPKDVTARIAERAATEAHQNALLGLNAAGDFVGDVAAEDADPDADETPPEASF